MNLDDYEVKGLTLQAIRKALDEEPPCDEADRLWNRALRIFADRGWKCELTKDDVVKFYTKSTKPSVISFLESHSLLVKKERRYKFGSRFRNNKFTRDEFILVRIWFQESKEDDVYASLNAVKDGNQWSYPVRRLDGEGMCIGEKTWQELIGYGDHVQLTLISEPDD